MHTLEKEDKLKINELSIQLVKLKREYRITYHSQSWKGHRGVDSAQHF